MSQLSDVIRSGIRPEDLTGLTPEQQQALEPLLRFVNTGIQGLSQALSGQVGSSNLDTEIQTVPLTSGVPQLVSLKKLTQARGVRSLSVGSADGKTQHALAQPLHLIGTTVPNQVKVVAAFVDTTATRVPVTFELTPDGSYTSLTPSSGTWTAPTLLNSWANFGSGRIATGYIKDSLGWVHLRGTLTNTPGTAANANLFLLPAGFRPSATLALSGQDVTAAAGAYRRIEIDSSGNVSPPVLVAAGSIFALDGIAFDTRS